MNDTINTIQKRRSIRAYRKKIVSQKDKDVIINAVLRSPTAGNMMLYSIIEVSDQDIKDKLVKSCDNQPFIAKAPFLLIFVTDYQRWMDYFKVCDVKSLVDKKNSVKRIPQEGDLMIASCDALIAAQTAVIAAESMGIGSCYIGDIMENFEYHKELFNLPKYAFPITLLCFGYPTEKSLQIEYTTRLEQKYVHYQNKYNRLNDDDLLAMYNDRKYKSSQEQVENFGQYMYLKKFTADFTIEMNRSVKQAIKEWCRTD